MEDKELLEYLNYQKISRVVPAREKIDWQETQKFDCQLVQTIFIFCCPYRHWRVATKSNFDS